MPISLYNSNEIQLPLVRISGSHVGATGDKIISINRNYAVELHNVLTVCRNGLISIKKKNNPSDSRLSIYLAGSAYVYQKIILLPDEDISISSAYVNISFVDKAVPAAAVPADLQKTQVPYAPITRPDFMAKDTVQTLPVLPTVFYTVPTIRSLREMGYSKKKAKKMLKQIREDHNA